MIDNIYAVSQSDKLITSTGLTMRLSYVFVIKCKLNN